MRNASFLIASLMFICLLAGCGKEVDISDGAGDYFMFNQILHYYDEDNGNAVPLCFEATCDHSNERMDTCTANLEIEYTYSWDNMEAGQGTVVECTDANVWYKDGYIYMLETVAYPEKIEHAYTDGRIVSLVRYDKYGNNKEKVIELNSKYELVGLCGDTDIGLRVIGDYLYYVKTVRAGFLGREPIVPQQVPDSEREAYINDSNWTQAYVSLYRVLLDGSSEPEQLSEEIHFNGWGSDLLEFIGKGVMIGGNDTEGITMVISNLGTMPSSVYGYLFEPKCQVYHYMPGDDSVTKVCEFSFENDMFDGVVHWKRNSPHVDHQGNFIFATVEEDGKGTEIYRMYAYSPKENKCELFYENSGIKTADEEGLEIHTFAINEDNANLYIIESTDEYLKMHVYDKLLNYLDTLILNSGKAGSFYSRMVGVVGYTDKHLIMGSAMPRLVIQAEDGDITATNEAFSLYDSLDEKDNKWTMSSFGMVYTFVIDKECIGTGKLKATKLMEYPYAGYGY